ncbi:hypothetical protein [Aquipseudomonas ullengensis]|uniref:Uncharacterized protein n=1 Tax=Aquipseudomonas ullengensis TaxID=2759166 RepID=A0A7W4QAJ0_9GAMM|nr:hypothetical protein [Pseudomonas ullengensis]MBB2495689.1 hypothetical protein [Pseudomonas ullengensis]
MRIDGFSSAYSLERSPRPGSAATPLREVQREVEERRDQPTSPSSSQGFEQAAQARRVQASSAGSDSLPARTQGNYSEQQRGLSARANQALAAYGNTASYTFDRDASEVLGLDLFA